MAQSRIIRLVTSLSFRVLIALVAGLAVGAAARSWGLPGGAGTAELIAAIGQLWLNALKMTIIPLVFGLLVTGIASIADAAATGRMALRALMVFALILTGAMIYGIFASGGLHLLWPIDPEGGRALLAGAPPETAVRATAQGGGLPAFLKSLAPPNPIKAASEDAILGIVVFAIAFGFAATRLPARLRLPLVTFFEGVSETMIVIVHWVLLAAPVGVFALALGVGLSAGVGAAGTLGHYIALVVLAQLGLIAILYAVAVIFGRIRLDRFARGIIPAQVVAFSTQSSLASLPAMVEQARTALGVSSATAGLVLPLAVAVFRATSPVANLAVCIYIAHLYGIALSPTALIAGGLTALAVSVGSVGLPGQISFFVSIAPICLAMGLPIEVLPLLLAVEVIPDIFRTIGNVTADLAAARIVEGGDATAEDEAAAGI
ncbi:MAG: dicarboxylate/amino acid:cation symporter [Brevundimonas sp.]|uniref:dicarboxylate/amino acid:cation symporter n=1 Tax=Brevundimonas sp. TaxID=1871086 RepID=UPI002727A2D8|nr:dicarboxylate/amino acid:cation symporter [Brevundimonas sp.]MDO9587211.1 dicarboxylate/amino acid:cation symporter [Brevundimonas sp.]MDP3657082.1 dicarboxylate/amino acid:cation symporter [Brevundimonas sp.]MDZ4113164.1 dicarboxylate/amino acid:cation symporter [Brevundimonas sp.]